MKFCMEVTLGGIHLKRNTNVQPMFSPPQKLWQFQSDLDEVWWGGVIQGKYISIWYGTFRLPQPPTNPETSQKTNWQFWSDFDETGWGGLILVK